MASILHSGTKTPEPYSIKKNSISFSRLSKLFSDSPPCEIKNGQQILRIGIVYSSGRHEQCTGQIGLVSDALYIPEILLEVNHICLQNSTELSVESFLDIDVSEQQKRNLNFILTGTGDINMMTAKCMQLYGSKLKVYFDPPNSANIRGIKKYYSYPSFPNEGALIACANPWSQGDRFIIIAGGIEAIGTVAASKLLLDFLRNKIKLGDDLFDQTVPAHIVEGECRDYEPMQIHPKRKCDPQIEVTNLSEDVGYSVVE